MTMLFTNNVENRLLNVQQDIFEASHIAEIEKKLKSINQNRNSKNQKQIARVFYEVGKFLLLELIRIEALHFYYFIVASSVEERITSLRKIIHYVARIEHRDPGTVVPRQSQRIVCEHIHSGEKLSPS